jgi:hypothetical protein
MWLPIHTAPFDAEIELAVIDRGGPQVLIFPCRQALQGWIKAETGEKLAVHSHWRPWVRWQSLDQATMVSPLNEIATEMV